MKTKREVFAEAARLIEARGKATGTYEDDDGRLCAVGALRVAVFGNSHYCSGFVSDGERTTPVSQEDMSLYNEVFDALQFMVCDSNGSRDPDMGNPFTSTIPMWNDASTQKTVVNVLQKMAGIGEGCE